MNAKAIAGPVLSVDTVKANKRDAAELAEIRPPKMAPVEVRVESHQNLHDIAVRYLGEFDQQRLREIQMLNPKLTNPDHIEPGQKIRLPGRQAVSLNTGYTRSKNTGDTNEP